MLCNVSNALGLNASCQNVHLGVIFILLLLLAIMALVYVFPNKRAYIPEQQARGNIIYIVVHRESRTRGVFFSSAHHTTSSKRNLQRLIEDGVLYIDENAPELPLVELAYGLLNAGDILGFNFELHPEYDGIIWERAFWKD